MNKEQAEKLLNQLADVECSLYYFHDDNNNDKFEEVRKNLCKVMEQFHELTK